MTPDIKVFIRGRPAELLQHNNSNAVLSSIPQVVIFFFFSFAFFHLASNPLERKSDAVFAYFTVSCLLIPGPQRTLVLTWCPCRPHTSPTTPPPLCRCLWIILRSRLDPTMSLCESCEDYNEDTMSWTCWPLRSPLSSAA